MALQVADAVKYTKVVVECVMGLRKQQDSNVEHAISGMILVKNVEFWATISRHKEIYELRLSVAVVCRVYGLWLARARGESSSSVAYNASPHRTVQLLQYSLTWLILHELSHADLGHFNLADSFGVAQRSSMKPEPLDRLPTELRPLAQPCFEMQADHEATEMLLGAYTSNGWTELRSKALAISGMMMLIECEDTKNGVEGRTHPKAATRIFQMLAHLAEMPLVRAQVDQDGSLIPSENDLQAFAHEVTIPCFFDALELANASGAASIADDLGSPEDFFKDLETVKLGDASQHADLKTQGAREWAKLWPCNEALKPILGGHFTN